VIARRPIRITFATLLAARATLAASCKHSDSGGRTIREAPAALLDSLR
jgi:hypothetical protein